jgi:hypothetical protein
MVTLAPPPPLALCVRSSLSSLLPAVLDEELLEIVGRLAVPIGRDWSE